jgi:tRNA modification GTPase
MISVHPTLQSDEHDVIVAQCSPQGSGAIALLRLSGDHALAVAAQIAQLSSGQSLNNVSSHTIHHGHVVDPLDTACPIDEVLFFVMHAPRTFTGQHTVEISCHNNQFIIQQIIDVAIKAGARHAQRGEFTKRAFLNGKFDLVQAEAINDVIHAQTELALRKSMAQLQGSLSSFLQGIQTEFVALLGLVEASFEFLDEEQRDFDFDQLIIKKCIQLRSDVRSAQENFNQQQQIKQGIRIALVGSVNVGKSTLFNALIRKDRAIVSDIAGTTRDSIETTIYRQGNFVLFIDTAGLRSTTDVIEKQGIERSWNEARSADVVLLVIDAADQHLDAQYHQVLQEHADKVIIVVNKVDAQPVNCALKQILDSQSHKTVYTSAKERLGIEALEEMIEKKIQYIFAQCTSPYLLNHRQCQLLAQIEARLDFIVNGFADGVHYELVAYQLKEILEKTAELTGRNVTEAMLDHVFSSFCVGK